MTNQPRGELVPGGLAMIIRSTKRPEHVGKIVELVCMVAPGEEVSRPCGEARMLRLLSSEACWLVKSESIVAASHKPGDAEREGWAFIRPSNLLPINPSADPIEITRQQEVEA